MTVVKEYRDAERFEGQPKLLTFFSGDSFNPSVESTVTKGKPPAWITKRTACGPIGVVKLGIGADVCR
jgi:hypothetical protein